MAPWALVRGVPDSFAHALCASPPDPPIDVDLARAQHAEYVAALTAAGLEVIPVPVDETCPDCCFIEDTAVLLGDAALLTRPGAVERRAEVDPVADALRKRLEVVRMTAPATLDGGDCLRLGKTLYVGASTRTNRDGIAHLTAMAAPRGFAVVTVALPPGVLHLKSVCSPLGDDTVLLAENTIPPDRFKRARVLTVPAREGFAANAVATGKVALVAASAPAAKAQIEKAGYRAIPVDTSELRKADGALTCLSIVSIR